MRLSYVIISYNRRRMLRETLFRLTMATPLARDQWETWVVDNASTDGSADAVHRLFPEVNLIRNQKNEGSFARNRGIRRAKGEYVIVLDDDSYPAYADTITAMLAHMDANRDVGALVGKVMLANGQCEASAFPSVVFACATCFRRSVLNRVGGFRRELFRQAEEYDISFRIWRAGFTVERRDDLIFRHDKTLGSAGRSSELVQAMDVRNNLIVANRFLPRKLRKAYWQDWLQRYMALAVHGGNGAAAEQALGSARLWRWIDGLGFGRRILKGTALEENFGLIRTSAMITDWARRNSVERVVLGDFGKNMWASYDACKKAGLEMRCVADDHPAFAGMHYRGLPILPVDLAFENGGVDGVVVTNINPAQVEGRVAAIRKAFRGPVLALWEPSRMATHVRPAAVA